MLTRRLLTLFTLLAVALPWPVAVPAAGAPPAAIALPAAGCTPNVVNYDIVYVRAPRFGDNTNSVWPDTVRPLLPDAGADLRLLHPNCTEEVLFPLPAHAGLIDGALGDGSVSDPNLSFNGEWVVFTYYHDQTDTNVQRCAGGGECLSYKGADIYRLHLPTRAVVRLTQQEFTPNLGNSANFNCDVPYTNCPNVGVFNVGPAFVSQADPAHPAIAFTSTRNNFLPPKAFNSAERTLQLFMMDWDGRNVTQFGYLNNAQALHPFQLADGRLMFTSWENQGARDTRQFNLWFIAPDGTQWNSGSGLGENATGHHFMTQMPNGDIAVVRYYNLNNNGFGDLVRYPLDPPGPDFAPVISNTTYMPLQRPAQVDLTPWTGDAWGLAGDMPAPCTTSAYIYPPVACGGGNISRVGKVTMPAAAPGGGVLLVYTRGSANHNGGIVGGGLAAPYYDGGLYLLPANLAQTGAPEPTDLNVILNDPAYNEQWPRPVVNYNSLMGVSQPAVWPDLANNGSAHLEANTPLALVGASSMTWRDTNSRPGPYGGDPDPFNASHEALFAWLHQGADAGLYADDDIYALRVLALLPSTDRTYPNDGPGYSDVGDERMRILGEIPVRHEGVIDGNGSTDTSFLVRLPADVPFTFQTLDRNGMVLNMAQTWHQLRPGEVRYDCGGCHAHTKPPLDFYTTAAGQPGFVPTDLALQTPLLSLAALNGSPATVTQTVQQVTVEYGRDIEPILAAKCAGCHTADTGVNGQGNLNLHDTGASPGTYFRLVEDYQANYGLGVPSGAAEPNYFIGPQLTRYIRAFQARESLLIWKLFGARLDGRTNGTRTGDIDYTPASDAIHPPLLTWAEKLTLARWVDLGAPIERDEYWGWLEDDLRPTLWVAPTILQARLNPTGSVVVGAYDLESGLEPNSLSVTFDVAVGAQPAGHNFATGLSPANGGTITVSLPAVVDLAAAGATLTVRITDQVGHVTEVVRTFSPSPQPISQLYLPVVDRLATAAFGRHLVHP